ncbi:hypothetical protein PM082_011701 [Marasmius tenuissimus]|nr:hypothetical protein PM082_011701 [Marasmius tenuissimus]
MIHHTSSSNLHSDHKAQIYRHQFAFFPLSKFIISMFFYYLSVKYPSNATRLKTPKFIVHPRVQAVKNKENRTFFVAVDPNSAQFAGNEL